MSVNSRLDRLEERRRETQPGEPVLIFLRYEGDSDDDGNVLFRVRSEGSTGTLYTKAELDALDFPAGSIVCIERIVRTREEAQSQD